MTRRKLQFGPNGIVSPMSEEFHEWLKNCPTPWYRVEVKDTHTVYAFEIDDDDE